jgi:uncharacterized protein (TIGR03643 family)
MRLSIAVKSVEDKDSTPKATEDVKTSISRIIEMAWEDRTPFEAIRFQFGLNESDVRQLMRENLKPSSFRMWRQRVSGRKTKHGVKSPNSP